jgi:hypothetical protein
LKVKKEEEVAASEADDEEKARELDQTADDVIAFIKEARGLVFKDSTTDDVITSMNASALNSSQADAVIANKNKTAAVANMSK